MASILLIDPNPATRSVLRAQLADAGHSVEGVGSLIAARGAVARALPDSIVVDLGNQRAGELVRGLGDLTRDRSVSTVLVALPEDLEPLRALVAQTGYRVVDKALDDSALIEKITLGLSSASPTKPPEEVGKRHNSQESEEALDPWNTENEAEEPEDSASVHAVYEELGVTAKSTLRALIYCDMHRLPDTLASLPSHGQDENRRALVSKLQQPVAGYEGRIAMVSQNGLAALFDFPADDVAGRARCFHAAIEMIYVAQQFNGWLKSQFRGRGLPDFAVGVALHCGEFEYEEGESDELDGELIRAITQLAQFTAVGAKKGWSLTASAAIMSHAEQVCRAGARVTVRIGGVTTELVEIAAVALDDASSAHEQIARILETNSALLRQAAWGNRPKPPVPQSAPQGANPVGAASRSAGKPNAPTAKPEFPPSPEEIPPGEPDPETGLTVPGYRVLRRLGKGGMAEVFLATHIRSGEERVLKMLPINDGEEEQLQRFIQEYALISQIRDANVARIHEQGFTQTHAYIAMEFLPGGEFREVMKRGLSVAQALDWAQAIAGALKAVHAKGIAHRDLKPANLMLRADGTLVLADFGIAKGQSDLLNRTVNGHIVGSPYYLSPEQAESKPVDARCDLYSFGIILFEMLTGNKPYKAANLSDLIRQHVTAPIPRLPDELGHFQALIDHLLAKKPSDRIASADLLLAELKSLRMSYEHTLVPASSGTSLKYVSHAAGDSPAAAPKLRDVYSVAVIGFDETERIVLASTLGLSVRRKPRFVEFDPQRPDRPDIYLVDARDMLYLQTMLASNLDRAVPTVLIGNSDFGTRWPVLKRPLQWAKIFEAFDRALVTHEALRSASVS